MTNPRCITSIRRTLAATALVSLLVASCSGDDEPTAEPTAEQTAEQTADAEAADAEAAAEDTADATAEATESMAEDTAESTESAEPPATSAPASTEPPAATAEPVVVEHALGTTEVPADPQRIIALDLSLVDAVLALELDLLGYTTFQEPDGPLPAYFGDAVDVYAADAAWVGDLLSPNLEVIAQLQPDLILTAAVRHENIYDQLSQIAPTIASDSAGGGWKDNLLLTGLATGRVDAAEQLIADYEQRAANVGAAINAAADSPTISVVRFVDVIRLYQPVSFSGVVLEDAGLARPESQQDRDEFIRVISEEEIALADGDVLIYTVFDNEAVQEGVGQLLDSPLWETLGAVQRDDVHAVVDAEWMSSVGMFGAQIILDDLAEIFGVDPMR